MPAAALKNEPAQVGAGDEKVVAGPGYRDIPRCKLPLQTEEAQREYDTLSRTLFDSGRLDVYIHSQLSLYAALFDAVTVDAKAGRRTRAKDHEHMQRAFWALKLDELHTGPVAASANAPVNKFSSNGFSARRR